MTALRSLEDTATRARRGQLAAIFHAGSGHPGGALSCTDLLVWLFEHLYRDAPPNSAEGGEQLVLSKGHACPALYAVGAEYGLLDRAELFRFRKLGSPLQGHTHVVDLPWTGASTGSLGQGFSVALGKALALRHRGLVGTATAILGDGELQEGEVWEGAMFAAHHGLDRLVAIVDYNRMQSDDLNENICGLEPLADKWRAFGWDVFETDGHDFEAIGSAVVGARERNGRPGVVIAHTLKGKGVSYMEGSPLWHGSVALSVDDTERALRELGADDTEVAAWIEGDDRVMSTDTQTAPALVGKSGDTLREAFGLALVELADEFPNLVVLDADIAGGTGLHHFREAFPDRFYQFGIAEQNMMAAAGGMASLGLLPVVTTFAVFCLRAVEQARLSIAYSRRKVVIAASHPGLDVGPDGGSAQCLEDLAAYRAIPGMTVVSPADPVEMRRATRAVLEHDGPVYLRTGRSPAPRITTDEPFEIGRGRILRDGSDVTLVACGVEVARALDAATELERERVSARVVNLATLSPVDADLLARCARETRGFVTAEDASVRGGLGSAVAESLARTVPARIEFVGMEDEFGTSGEPDELAAHYRIDAPAIARAARRVLARP